MKQEILEYIQKNGQAAPSVLIREFGLSGVMVHRHLLALLNEGKVLRVGKSPKVFYTPNQLLEKQPENIEKLDNKYLKTIEENFAYILPTGTEMLGVTAFRKWCTDRKVDAEQMAEQYYRTNKEYRALFQGEYIDATSKIRKTFGNDVGLDSLHYLFFYSLPVFGRTKIASWLFFGKQLQQKELIRRVLAISLPLIEKFISENNIQAITYVPPSVPRQIQFMKELENALKITIPKIRTVKAHTEITIQQKSLKRVEDRIENANKTMFVEGANQNFGRVLVVDDFTGSGSTLNTIAKKLKQQNLASEVLGLTITGSVNGFEVVKEV